MRKIYRTFKIKQFVHKFIRSFVIVILLNSFQSFYGQYKYLFWAGPDKLWNIITEYIMRIRNREKEERGKEMEDGPATCVNNEQSKIKKKVKFGQNPSLLESNKTTEGSDNSLLV